MSDYARVVDFIHEMYGSSEFVPLSVPKFIGNEKKYLNECIDTTFVSSVGKFVDRFEEEMARYTGLRKQWSVSVERTLSICLCFLSGLSGMTRCLPKP